MRSLPVLLAAAALAGCGGSVATPRSAPDTRREWVSNVAVLIDQLRNDVAQTQLVGATPRAAREALRDESALYALLIAYSDLSGCRHIVASAGAPPPGAAAVGAPLGVACRHLERAAALFTEAATHGDGRPLAAATLEARRALPALVRAAAELRRTGSRLVR